MSRIIIVGAGSFARELDAWIAHDTCFADDDEILFIDDNVESLLEFSHLKSRFLCSIDSFKPLQTDRLFMGISNPKLKQIIVEKLSAKSINFSTFIHKSAIVAADAVIGTGSIICPGVVVSVGVKIGTYVTFNPHSTVGHDASVGPYSSLMSHVDITGGVTLGSGVFVGSHATVLPGITIEQGATIGAGSVVIRRVKSGTTVFGAPARVLWND